MDPKLLCSSLSLLLVKTIKAICEFNVKYDQKLEITGSLHVRSDGERVLTCLLDETTIKGQQEAKPAEMAAPPLALPNMGFPFPSLQLQPNASQQPQPMATFLSPIQTMAPLPPQAAVLASERSDKALPSPSAAQVAGAHDIVQMTVSQAGTIVHHERQAVKSVPQENHRSSAISTSASGLPPVSVAVGHPAAQHQPMQVDFVSSEAAVQAELQQAMVSLRRQSSSSGSSSSTEAKTPSRTAPSSVVKMLEANQVSLPANSASAAAVNAVAAVAAVAQNHHVRLPNIQTLTQCLPKYPQVKMEAVSVANATALAESLSTGLATPKADAPKPISSAQTTPTSAANMAAMTFPVDPLASVKVEVQQQLDSDGNLVHKKKFQCMFCGIFLSTKCYLKNHINAMHTRARVYPCELCERYFYSAGALRIHKLRNHWQGSKKHKCTHCSETFLLPIELRKHILKKHLGSPEAMLMEGSNPAGLSLMMSKTTSAEAAQAPSLQAGHAAEAALAAASLAVAAGLPEPLALVTSAQNLSSRTASSDSPASVSASLDDSHTSLPHGEGSAGSGEPLAMDTHADIMLSTTAVQSSELGNGRGRQHDPTVIAPISPPTDGLPPHE